MVDVSRLSDAELDVILAPSRERVSDPDLQAMSEAELDAFAQSLTRPPSGSAGAAPVPVRTAEVPSGGAPEASGYMLPATLSKGIVKGLTSLPDLLARGAGAGMGFLAEKAGFPEAAEQLRSPFTFGGALDVLQPTSPDQGWAEATGEGIGGALSGVGLGNLLSKSVAPVTTALGERLATSATPVTAAIGEKLAKSVAPVTAAVGQTLAEQPILQSVAGGLGGLSSYTAERLGYGPTGQMVAGLLGGFAPVAATNVASAGARALLAPLSGEFAETGAGNLLRQNVSADPRTVARNIRMQAEANTLPGVRPTTAEVAGDPGLAGLQRSLNNVNNLGAAGMSDRMQANMAARARAITEAGGTGDPEALLQASIARQQELDALTRRAAERVGTLNPADVSGETLRAQLDLRAAAAKAAAQEKYAAIPEDVEPIQIGAFEPNDMRGAPEVDTSRVAFEKEGRAATGAPGALSRAGFEVASSKPGETLLGWIRSSGGITRSGPEVADLEAMGITPKTMPGLFNNNRGSFTKGAARTNLGRKGNRLDDLSTRMVEAGWLPEGSSMDDALNLIADDWRSMGQRGASRVSRASPEEPSGATATADDISEYWGRELSDRGLDPSRMQAEDWDAFYRDMGGPPLPIGEDDIAFLAAGADKATGRVELSPFQASLMTLRRKFFPGTGLPADSSVSALMRQLENADVLSARQTERIVSDLRSQAGLLKTTDPRSGALAKSVADATEGLLMQQAGPARAAALRDARAAWRDYKTTFAENEPGRILGTDRFNRPILDVSRAPGVAVPSGVTGGTATRRLAAAAGPDVAEQAAREELRRALDLAGDSSTRISALMAANRYGPVLAEYPALAAEVTAARDAAAMAEAFSTSRLGRLSTSNVSPSQTVATAVEARDKGAALRNIAGAVRNDPAAQAGLRRALIEYVLPSNARGAMTAAGDVVASPLRTMETLGNVLERTANTNLFNSAQRKVLNETLRQLKSLRFANTAARVSGSDTMMNKGILANKVSRLVLDGTMPGAGRAVRMLDAVIGAVADTDAIGALAREAMLDPQLAARLLERVTPSRLSQLADTLNATVRGAAAGAVTEDIQPENTPPVEDDTGLSTMPMGAQ